MTRKRILYLVILLLLLALLGGLVYAYLSLGGPAKSTAAVTDVQPGLKHVRSIYAYGKGADALLQQPYGIAYRDGKLYVGQMPKGNVVIFDANGNPLGVVGKKGRGVGELNNPAGVTVDGSGNIYVADTQHAKVVEYDAGGKLVKELTKVTQPLTPLVVDDQRLYLSTFGSIKIYSLPGLQELSSWGKRGRAEAEYDFPNGIAVSDGGNTVFVSDGNNMRLKRLDKNGEKVWIVGSPPKDMNDNDRLFGLPAGMALAGDVLYVVDPLNGSIHLFRTDGTNIGEVGESGAEEGQFSYPSQIAYMGGKRFAITEWGNDRVQIVDIDPEAVARETAAKTPSGASSTEPPNPSTTVGR